MIQKLKKTNTKLITVLSIFLLINLLFTIKYNNRQNYFPEEFLSVLYVFFVSIGFYFLNKFKTNINAFKHFNLLFLFVTLFFFILELIVVFSVDGSSLNVDRWSAMEITIKGILNGEYPYALKDHLGKTSSNLPGLSILGLPFYLLGDVGLLQPIIFLGLIFTLYKLKYSNIQKLIILFLLLISPSYLWEVFVKSDLMSNLFLVVLFMILWDKYYKNDYFKNPILLSLFCAFFILTRGIVLIPLIIFLFKDFLNITNKNKLKFVLGFLFFTFLISLPVLLSIKDISTVIEHNPFNHQTRFSPLPLIIVFLILPFIFSIRLKNIKQRIFTSYILLSTLLFLTFSYNLFIDGFKKAVIQSNFDISYLGMIIPFAIFSFVYFFDEKNTMHA